MYSAYILASDLMGDGRYNIKIRADSVEGQTEVVVGGRGRSSGALEMTAAGTINVIIIKTIVKNLLYFMVDKCVELFQTKHLTTFYADFNLQMYGCNLLSNATLIQRASNSRKRFVQWSKAIHIQFKVRFDL